MLQPPKLKSNLTFLRKTILNFIQKDIKFSLSGSFRTIDKITNLLDKNQSGSHRLELRSCKNSTDEQSDWL